MFGTDGIRGIANRELTPEIAYKMGRVAGYVLTKSRKGKNAFLLGRDTRISGPMLEGALVAGLTSVGINVHLSGVITTPATAYLIKELDGCGGAVISASHNAFHDNGIKFFSADGFKLPDSVEEEMESLFFAAEDKLPRAEGEAVGSVYTDATAGERYLEYLLSTVSCCLNGVKIVLDCANGAAYRLAPAAFSALGASVITINNQPNGININRQCGSTHPETICQAVRHHQAHLGFTFDGDADRVLAVDETGKLVDGDAIMIVLAKYLQEKGRLKNNALVATVMSNLGLEIAAQKLGLKLLRTKVGDRYVLEEMLAGGYNLGGEQSGHIILLDHNTTGDGLLTALHLAFVMAEKGQTLAELAADFIRYPQVLVNCRAAKREGWEQNQRIQQAMQEVQAKLEGRGRLLVRPSGTEPLIRVMVEGEDEAEIKALAENLAAIITEELA